MESQTAVKKEWPEIIGFSHAKDILCAWEDPDGICHLEEISFSLFLQEEAAGPLRIFADGGADVYGLCHSESGRRHINLMIQYAEMVRDIDLHAGPEAMGLHVVEIDTGQSADIKH